MELMTSLRLSHLPSHLMAVKAVQVLCCCGSLWLYIVWLLGQPLESADNEEQVDEDKDDKDRQL